MYYLAPVPAPPAVAAMAEEAAVAAAAAAAAVESPMRKNLKWKKYPSGVPSMPSLTLPTITADDDMYMDPRIAMSPNLPGGAASLFAATGVHPAAAAAAAAYGFAACTPGVMLERLGPHILRSHVSTVQSKPIPHNDGIDLEAFRRKDPREWSMDEVIGWMISVAKRRGIPVEDMNMHRFANCTGPLMSLMNQQNFIERDSTYGALLYVEFRKLMGDESCSFLDDLERLHKDESGPSGFGAWAAASVASTSLLSSLAAVTEAAAVASSLYGRMTSVSGAQAAVLNHGDGDDVFGRPSSFHQRESVIKAAGTSTGTVSLLAGADAGSLPESLNLPEKRNTSDLLHTTCDELQLIQAKALKSLTSSLGHTTSEQSIALSAAAIPKFPDGKIKKKHNEGSCSITLSGKPRKRSQHTRGNKLWEFIRSALRDSATCPSVVKWEDEHEGVFRIVESEKLARLWGEKKNNKKMTYEKLSRAMRTYYEKQILVPVPKTGLYPKKLVYKFGPNAKGWQQKDSASISQATTIPKLSIRDGSTKNTALATSLVHNTAAAACARFGITSLVSSAENGAEPSSSSSSGNSAAVVAAANGLMSLADAASRQLMTGLCNDSDENEVEEVIEVDNRSETGEITGAIEETLVNEVDVDGDEDMYDDDRDTPPPLLE